MFRLISKQVLIARIALLVVALILVSLLVNWLLIPHKVVRLFGEGHAPLPKTELVLATWNLCHARGDNNQPWPVFESSKRDERLAEMVRVLAESRPDIVVLNECTFASTGIGGPNQAAYLADQLGLKWRAEQRNGDVWALATGHQWGNAVLSRFPILSASFLELPQLDTWSVKLGLKRKHAVLCRVAIGNGKVIRLVATHLPVGKGADELRIPCADAILNDFGKTMEPAFVLGDLNCTLTPGTAVSRLLQSGQFALPGESHGGMPTFPASKPVKRIDWILTPRAWRVIESKTLSSQASDHLPVLLKCAFPEN
jgi:endonuclease/exonuclease/phosphatase family metal-dependent hydrolase